MSTPSTSELSDFLSQSEINAGLIDRLKIAYRPYICPFDKLLKLIQPGNRVYDIGCGSGQFLLLAAHFTESGALYGVEISETLIYNARQQFEKKKINIPYHLQTYDGRNLPNNIKEADILFMIDVLHHIPSKDQYSFLFSLYNAMRTDAILVLKDIDAKSPFVYCNKMHDLILAKEIGNEISVDAASQLAKKCGFTVKNSHYQRMLWYPHYTLVLAKA